MDYKKLIIAYNYAKHFIKLKTIYLSQFLISSLPSHVILKLNIFFIKLYLLYLILILSFIIIKFLYKN